MTTIRCLLYNAAKKNWDISQFDVTNAFLQRDLQEEVHIKFLCGMKLDNLDFVCRLQKSLYRLKQASQQWYAKLTDALCFKGFSALMNDYFLFLKQRGNLISIVEVYVNDILITVNDAEEIRSLKIVSSYKI